MARQDTTARLMDMAINEYGSVKVTECSKKCLQAMANTFLGDLLGRQELTESMETNKVSEAIKGWIVQICGFVGTMRLLRLFFTHWHVGQSASCLALELTCCVKNAQGTDLA